MQSSILRAIYMCFITKNRREFLLSSVPGRKGRPMLREALLTHGSPLFARLGKALLGGLVFVVCCRCDARLFHVADSGDGSDGSSWGKAFTTVSAALIVAGSGDALWVKAGRYREALDLKSGVGIYGGFAGTEGDDEFALRDWLANETIVDATGLERTAVIAHDVFSATLDGLTVTGAYEQEAELGGGLDIRRTSIRIQDCRVTGNAAQDLGGIRIEESTVSIVGTAVISNHSPLGGFRIAGGIECVNSQLFMDDCVVSDHEGSTFGGLDIANSGPGLSAVVEDCTVTDNVGSWAGGVWGWRDVTFSRCYIADNTCEGSLGLGGGIRISDNCVIRDCTIANNSGTIGGGIGVDVAAENCKIINCSIIGNRSSEGGGGVDDSGWDTYIENCEIRGNSCDEWWGGGGGISTSRGILLEGCLISHNRARTNGGGIHIYDGGVFRRCTVSNNSCGGYGGGFSMIDGARRDFVNCLFAGNRAEDGGGAMFVRDERDRPTALNCTFVDNQAPVGTAIYNQEGDGSFTNCIFVDGGPSEIHEIGGAATLVRYSRIEGGWPGEGNIDEDPVFRDPDKEDYRLQVSSPCIDAASISGATTDLDGRLRPVDIPGIGRDGEGAFDMGAYEYPLEGYPTPTPAATPTGTTEPTSTPTATPSTHNRCDINEDGRIDAMDLLILLGQWQLNLGAETKRKRLR